MKYHKVIFAAKDWQVLKYLFYKKSIEFYIKMKFIQHLTFIQFSKTVIELVPKGEGGNLFDGLLK